MAAILIMASAAFGVSFSGMRRGILRSEAASKGTASFLEADMLLRKEIRKISVPYWKNFDAEFDGIKERLLSFCSERGIDAVSVSSVYDRKHNAEGIRMEWNYRGRRHSTQEFIRQRITDENE